MFRAAICDLKKWQTKPKRKPLVVRGARQVGKTYLIRQFGHECFHNTVELNFERQPELAQLFASKDWTVMALRAEPPAPMSSPVPLNSPPSYPTRCTVSYWTW